MSSNIFLDTHAIRPKNNSIAVREVKPQPVIPSAHKNAMYKRSITGSHIRVIPPPTTKL